MEPYSLLAFGVGLLVGLVVALVLSLQVRRKYEVTDERARVDIGPITCQSGGIAFTVSADQTLCGLPLVHLHSFVYGSGATISSAPEPGSATHSASTTQISHSSVPATGTAVVWA